MTTYTKAPSVSSAAIQDALADYANRVAKRLLDAPRYTSIGREKYVYVGDVQQVLDEELHSGGAE